MNFEIIPMQRESPYCWCSNALCCCGWCLWMKQINAVKLRNVTRSLTAGIELHVRVAPYPQYYNDFY